VYLGINVREARGARAGALHVRSASDRDERAGSAEKCLKETGCTCAAANRAGTGERQHGLRMRTAAACRPRPCFCRCSVKTALCAEACVCGREERRRVGVARGMMAGGVKVAPAIVLCLCPAPCLTLLSPLVWRRRIPRKDALRAGGEAAAA
jgi:hypothetical protein